MPSYFEENRFQAFQRRRDQSVRREHTHESNDDMALVPRNPTRGQRALIEGPGLLGNIQDAALWFLDVRRNNRAGEIQSEIASKVPTGKEITIEISSPGDWGGTEDVELFYSQDQVPPAYRDPNTNYRQPITIKGTGGDGPMPTTIPYTRPDGSKEELPIQGTPPSPPPEPKRHQNSIDSEPLGLDFRFGDGARTLGADARGDRGYPGSDHMRA